VKAFVRSAAQADILRQYRYYLVSQDAPAIASRFLDAADETMRAIARQPGIGSPKLLRNKGLRGLRGRPVPGFESTKVYYLDTPTTLSQESSDAKYTMPSHI
jgi:hypothetical protein